MTTHPLLLSTPMVLAFLAGRKSVSRRIPTCTNSLVDGRRVSGKTWKALRFDWNTETAFEKKDRFMIYSAAKETPMVIKPIYQLGDTLWFKETFQSTKDYYDCGIHCGQGCSCPKWMYKATEPDQAEIKWRPSIFMPKAACRLWADCGAVTCEHLDDITEEQAEAEGVDKSFAYEVETPDGGQSYVTHRAAFKRLWERIHGPLTWSLNPPVYAINFNPTTRKP